MIPHRIFWLFDLVILITTFWAAYRFTPSVASLFAPGGPLRTPWLESLASPSIRSGQLPPFTEPLWIFMVMTPATLLVLGALGNYEPLLF